MSEQLIEQVQVSMKQTVTSEMIEKHQTPKFTAAELLQLKQEERRLKKIEFESNLLSASPDKYFLYLQYKREKMQAKKQQEKPKQDENQVDFLAFAKKLYGGASHFFSCVQQSFSSHWLGFDYTPIGSTDIDDTAIINSGKRKLE